MLNILNHPLITHKLSIIRRKETGTKDFRENLDELAALMAYEITKDVPLSEIDIRASYYTRSMITDVLIGKFYYILMFSPKLNKRILAKVPREALSDPYFKVG